MLKVYLVPEGSQVFCISHGRVETSGEGNVNVEPDSRATAHLWRGAQTSSERTAQIKRKKIYLFHLFKLFSFFWVIIGCFSHAFPYFRLFLAF